MKKTIVIFVVILLFPACKPKPRVAASENESASLVIFKQDFLFQDDRPFAQCHASTLLRTKNHKFLVAWFGGTHEKHDDVGIWLSKGLPGSWSTPIEIAKLREDPHWNPVLFEMPDGAIILYFKVGKTIDEWETWYMISEDNGESWTEAKELVPGDKGGRGPVRNKPIILSDGTWLAPASNERKGVWNTFVDRSEDGGKTWTATPFLKIGVDSVSGEGVIQPTLWESEPGKVHMLLRSSYGVICRSDSEDYGKTWSPIYKTNLPNPNSAIDVTRLSNGVLVLVFNPVGENWGDRFPISVAVSKDNGLTWPTQIEIETGKDEDEFSYPTVIHYGDTVAGTYTWNRQRIAFWMGKAI